MQDAITVYFDGEKYDASIRTLGVHVLDSQLDCRYGCQAFCAFGASRVLLRNSRAECCRTSRFAGGCDE